MERKRLLERLSAAKRHVEEGESHIAAQKRAIDDRTAVGGDTTEAKKMLRMCEVALQNLIAEEERILDALDNLSDKDVQS